jgi:hypothetical protein
MSAESPAAEPPDCLPPPARVTVGQRWRGLYLVNQAIGESAGRWFTATREDTAEKVWLRVSSKNTAADRHAVWQILKGIDSPHLQQTLAAHDGDERVEIWRAPDAPTLRRWRVDRDEPSPAEIQDFVRQISTALELLHTRGLGHFNVRPDHIYVREGAAGPEYFLGGFDAAERFDQTELIPITVDAHYAPPEAAGLFNHSPGQLLLSWDWWTLGRTVQELILAQHVVMLTPDELLTNPVRHRSEIIEALLFERDIGTTRAGAIEWMPRQHPTVDLLLRGLLASAREARWSLAQVREWLAGDKPKERYSLPRQQRFFQFEGRGHTAPEAAQLLRSTEHCATMVSHVFGFEKPGQFAHFLYDTRSKHDYIEPLEQATKLFQAPALKATPLELVHEISAHVALLAISGGEFLWRGQPLATAIPALLTSEETIETHTALLRALGQPVVLDLIKKTDSGAGRQLEAFVKGAIEAETLLLRVAAKRPNPKAELRDLWQLAWLAPTPLNEMVEQLRRDCACTTNAHLEKIFSTPQPTRGMSILLAWTSRDPRRHGYKTHAEVKQEKLAALTTRGRAHAQLLFWLRLESALAAGPLLFGSRWPILGGSLTVVLLLAVHVPGPLGLALGFVPFTVLAAVRLGLNRWQARLTRQWAPTAKPWQWRDSIPRCQREAKALAEAHGLTPNATEITKTLAQINRDITTLAKPDPYPAIPLPPRHLGAWAATALSWLALAGLTAGSVWRGIQRPPSWEAHTVAWHETFNPPKAEIPVAPKDQKISWPYKLQINSPFPPLELKVEGVFDPTPEQYKAALSRAQQLTHPYKPETIEGLIAIHTQLTEDRVGLLLYDGQKRTFMARNGVVIRFTPNSKQWLKLGDKFAIYIEK